MTGSRITAPSRAIGLLAAIVCLQPSRSALADVTTWYFGDSTHYAYQISHVPDFDQKRLLLPNTGNAYCVPTAAINWMAYFANHGAPLLRPGPGNWQSQALYNDATDAITDMGLAMNTHPDNGTIGPFAELAIAAWGDYYSTPLVVSRFYTVSHWSPDIDDICLLALNGAYVITGVGWYYEYGDIIVRNGGHALSLTEASRDGFDLQIGWRDPARDDEGSGDPSWLSLQSPFATETYAIEQRWVYPLIPDAEYRVMSKVLGYGSGYIDSVLAIYPQFVLTSSLDLLTIHLHHAIHLFGSASPDTSVFDTALGTSSPW